MSGNVSVRDELSASSQSLAERFESSRWLGQVAGLEKLRLKLNSTPLPHVPSCSSAWASWPLHVSLHCCPSHSAHALEPGTLMLEQMASTLEWGMEAIGLCPLG